MSEQHDASTEPVDDEQTTDQADDAEVEQSDAAETEQPSGDDEQTPNSEAARYRRRLREAEAERDAAHEQLAELRRQVAEDASGLAVPSALWHAGVDVGDVFSDDGRLDRGKLSAAVEDASAQLGLRQAPRGNHVPNEGRTPGESGGGQSMIDIVMGRDE